MKRYWKVYLITVLISGVCLVLPWLLANTAITSEVDVLEWQGILSGIVALAISVFYVVRRVKEWKSRLLILLLNPAIYYMIVLACIGISFASESWHGFDLGG